jgi:hypothetical protein
VLESLSEADEDLYGRLVSARHVAAAAAEEMDSERRPPPSTA